MAVVGICGYHVCRSGRRGVWGHQGVRRPLLAMPRGVPGRVAGLAMQRVSHRKLFPAESSLVGAPADARSL
jgi:hypothetical protein